MSNFTVRVELHTGHKTYDPLDSKDYDNLHTAMKAEGFSTTIKIDKISYHLPRAEYNKVTDNSKDEVMNAAKRACAKTGREYSLLITEDINPRGIFNLKPVLK